MYFKIISNCKHEVTITENNALVCMFTVCRDIGRCPLFSHRKPQVYEKTGETKRKFLDRNTLSFLRRNYKMKTFDLYNHFTKSYSKRPVRK